MIKKEEKITEDDNYKLRQEVPEKKLIVEENSGKKDSFENSKGDIKNDEKMRSRSPTPKRKPSIKKYRKTSDNNQPKIATIGGQKVDLNSDKPQYLKLTIEQIQLLALQQKSGELLSTPEQEIAHEHEHEHYCAMHSPIPRRKLIRGKTEKGRKVPPKKSTAISENNEGKAILGKQNEAPLPGRKLHPEAKLKITRNKTVGEKSFSRRSLSPAKPASVNDELGNKYGTNQDYKKNILNKQETALVARKTSARNISFKSTTKHADIAHEDNKGAKEESPHLLEEKIKPDLQTKSPSPSPLLSRRSLSLPRWSIARSPSPIHKALDPPTNPMRTRVTYTPSITRKTVAQTIDKTDPVIAHKNSSEQLTDYSVKETNSKEDEQEESKDIITQEESQNSKSVKNLMKKPIRKLLSNAKSGKQEPLHLNIIQKVLKPNKSNDSKSKPNLEKHASPNMSTSRDISDISPDHLTVEKQSIKEENKASGNKISERNKELGTQKNDGIHKKGKICKLLQILLKILHLVDQDQQVTLPSWDE